MEKQISLIISNHELIDKGFIIEIKTLNGVIVNKLFVEPALDPAQSEKITYLPCIDIDEDYI